MTADPQHPPRVHVDPDVMGGVACFAGSRLPIDTVLASVDAGESWARVVASWPWLTAAHLHAARVWARQHAGAAAKR